MFVDPLESLSSRDLQSLVLYFMDFVRYSRRPPICASTIDQYTAHVAEHLVRVGVIDSTSALRSSRSRFLLTAYRLADASGNPHRLQVAIPLSYSLLCDAIVIVRRLFATSPALVSGVSAAFALGYGASLRPGEYTGLATRQVDLDHQCSSSMTHCWFDQHPYCVTDPAAYPPGRLPDHITGLLDFRKNDQRGKGGPWAIARSTAAVDCVSLLFAYLRVYPPLPHQPLLSGHGAQVNADTHIRPVLSALADLHSFPRANMRASSSIRSGRLVQLDDAPDHVKQQLGHWRSLNGMLAYHRSTLQLSSRITAQMHDASLCPTTTLQYIYGTAAEAPGPARQI